MRRWLVLSLLPIAIACSSREKSSARAESTQARSGRALTPEIGAELRAKLQAALLAKGPAYVPRTRHRGANGAPKYTNRLILETSPYLLQHAHNPVNWFPWGEEAFAIARATGRPVFLSVGYSTCHWCHVMEEESFEDEEIARAMNARYVCIKVDREERPDVDAVYMTAVQMLSGSGGWPMSVWLTPAREPFFAGTYFPPRDGARGGRKGFLSLVVEQAEAFRSDPKGLAQQAAERSESIRRALAPQPPADLPGARELGAAARNAEMRYDAENGGARGAPKFPSSFPVRLLLRHYARTGDARARDMALDSLRKMAAGGIYDHVGGGFHRYSVDAHWLVPHFEKMLYDNALLGVAYLEGFQASGEELFARVARETLDYVLREMTAREGGFWSATDADSQTPTGRREEGYFFTWTHDELYAALSAERARAVEAYFAVTGPGNFEGRNVLHVPRPPAAVASELGISERDLELRLADAVAVLRAVRARRAAPLLDDKIQTSWNGLMLSALARGALVLGERRYAVAAERAAAFITKELRKGGRLRHAFTRGRTTSSAYLDDYAYLAAGLLDLFEVEAAPALLEDAIELMDELERYHADPVSGGYFSTAGDSERLLARDKPDYDGALPSGNSVALLTLLRLYELTGQERFRERAETTARAFSSALAAAPASESEMLLGVDFMQSTPLEIAVVLPEGAASVDAAPGAPALLGVLGRSFVPNRVVVIASEADCDKRLGELVPWLRDKRAKAGRARAYVCVRGACELPTSDPAVFRRQLEHRPGAASGERG